MKIALISDSHDNVANLEKLIRWLNRENISILIHAGDLCAPGVLVNTLAPKFKGKIHLISGNVGDKVLLEKLAKGFPSVKYYGQGGKVEIGGRKIGLVHFKKEVEELIKKDKFDLIVFGHTHKPEIQKIDRTQLVNPGTVGGLYNKPTFAIYETEMEKIEIKEL